MGSPAARIGDPTVHGGVITVGFPTVLIGGPPASRIGDMHTCPQVTVLVPHVGGPLILGSFTVLTGGVPQSRVGDALICVGPPDAVMQGCPTVLVGMAGGGLGFGAILSGLIAGAENFLDQMDPVRKWRKDHQEEINQALTEQRKMLEKRKAAIEKWDAAEKAHFKTYFGKDDEASRKVILDRIDKELALNKKMTIDNFSPANPPSKGTYAYVYPNDKNHTVYLDQAFEDAPVTGEDSKAGTLSHEMSHFDDVGGTKDHQYGEGNCKQLAKDNPDQAMTNADSFEYYVEKAP